MVSEYEKNRENNIRKNRELLASLGLDKPPFEPKAKRIQRSTQPKKRKAPEATDSTENDDEDSASKLQRVDANQPSTPSAGLRRSARNIGKALDYSKEREVKPLAFAAPKSLENTGPEGSQGGNRMHNPKTYGSIPGIAVSTWWHSRRDCSVDAIHAPWVGGISGGSKGAYSVCLSGGYEDDVDLGYAFTFTGSGGRDLKGTKDKPKNLRTAPQSSDQDFEHSFNRMLMRSAETRNPVRVVRGFKGDSKYAPYEGYRYDGLYVVEKAWREQGNNPQGYLVCKYAFKRLPGQPPLPVRADDGDDDDDDDDGNQSEDADEPQSSEEEGAEC